MQLFREVVSGGKTKRFPKTWVIVIGIAIVLAPFGWQMVKILSPQGSAIARVQPGIKDRVAPLANNDKGITAAMREQTQRKETTAIAPEKVSIKRGIATKKQQQDDQKRSQEAKRLEFYQSGASLGQKAESKDNTDLSKRPLWERYKKGGMDAATQSQGDRVLRDSTGQNPKGSNGQDGKPQIKPEDTLRQILAQKKSSLVWGQPKTAPLKTTLEAQTNNEVSEHFLPPAQMIPVTFVTGVNTRGKGDGKVLLQVARPVIAQHNLQLLPTTRILCRVGTELLTDRENISRIVITPEKIIYPNGSWQAMSSASLYDARDRGYGVIAKRYVPDIWKRLLPIAISNLASATLEASREQTGTDTYGKPVYSNTTANALKAGAADTLDETMKIKNEYIARMLNENQPYAIITPGASAFIMLDDTLDLAEAGRGGNKNKRQGITPPIADNPFTGIGDTSILQQLSTMPNLQGIQGITTDLPQDTPSELPIPSK